MRAQPLEGAGGNGEPAEERTNTAAGKSDCRNRNGAGATGPSGSLTLVVNAHGGLLEMGPRVTTGERLFLDNPSAGRREACKVVGVRKSRDGQLAVAFEFVNPAPQFWPIAFPPVDWHLVKS